MKSCNFKNISQPCGSLPQSSFGNISRVLNTEYKASESNDETLRAPVDVRLFAGRFPVHGGVVVVMRPVPLPLVWRRVQGAARGAVLVVGHVRGHLAVPAAVRRPRSETQQAAGHQVAAERGRTVRVHDVHHVRDHRRVPDADDAAFGRHAGRRVSAPAT